MMEERYHETTQNRFYPDMSNVNKNITVEAKLISPPTYFLGAFARLCEETASSCLFVCLSVDRMEQLGSHRTDFHEI